MADTRFTDASGNQAGTLVQASWLNDVNTNTYTILSAVAGTNAVTGNGASTVTVGYPRGVAFRFIPQNTNTTAVTINISGLGVKNVTKYGTTPLVAGDLVAGSWAFITYDGTQFQLLNPLSVPTNVSALPGRLLNTQTFTASGTYTPTVGTTTIIVEVVGGGGAGGGAVAAGAGTMSLGGGGGAGAYSRGKFAVPVPTAVTIGAGGVGVAGASGNPGIASSLGALITAPGGAGGATGTALASTFTQGGAGGGLGIGGNLFAVAGARGNNSIGIFATGAALAGDGGTSAYGGGGAGLVTVTGGSGANATANSGGGGGGAANYAVGGLPQGGTGGSGLIVIYEYS